MRKGVKKEKEKKYKEIKLIYKKIEILLINKI